MARDPIIQPVASVTDGDVRRIADRDFGGDAVLALGILEEAEKQSPLGPRVKLAVMKLADGDLDRLLDTTQLAMQDYRDVLAAAEYPRYTREVGFNDVADDVAKRIIDEDWRQFETWLRRK